MKVFPTTILFVILISLSGFSQRAFELSDDAQISVITIGPYDSELFQAFGHSAIRVYDPARGYDAAYNYGTFDFDQPNFYLNFVKGIPFYKLGLMDYQALLRMYIYQDRYVHEQIMDLNQIQKQKVFNFLQNNALPENAGYYYDYFYDNCATRLPDVFVQVFGDSVRFDGSYITSDRSIRELCDDYLMSYYPWGDFGIDFCLGMPMDKVITPFQYMFLPDYVESGFSNAYLTTRDGEKPLVARTIVVNEKKEAPKKPSFFTTPLFWFLLFAVIVAFFTWKNRKGALKGIYFDAFFFGLLGLLGLFLFFLWIATSHKAAANNFNLLWVFPIHLFAAIALIRKRLGQFWNIYFRATAIAMLLLILTWMFLPQLMHYSLVPLWGAILIRSVYIGWGEAYAKRSSPNA